MSCTCPAFAKTKTGTWQHAEAPCLYPAGIAWDASNRPTDDRQRTEYRLNLLELKQD
jgi:hypothetical protein